MITDYNLQFFLENNKDLTRDCLAFKGVSPLLDNQFSMGNIRVGYGGGIEIVETLNIPDKDAFSQMHDHDRVQEILEHVAFVTAVNPIATMSMRKGLYNNLEIHDQDEFNEFYNNTDSLCIGQSTVTCITLALVWAATCRNQQIDIQTPIGFFDFFTFARFDIPKDSEDFANTQYAIREISNSAKSKLWENISYDEAYDIFNNTVEEASNFKVFDYILNWKENFKTEE